MNRFIYILSILLVVASCSNDVTIDVPENALITFRASLKSKGVEITKENLNEFYATSFVARITTSNEAVIDKFFENVIFSRPGETADCYYSETPYYRPAKRPMTFLLYYPSEDDLGVKFNWNCEVYTDPETSLMSIVWIEKQEDGTEEFTDIALRGFSPKKNISQQKDFIYGFAEMPVDEHWTSNDGDIQAVFFHALAQVEIMAKECSQDYQYNIAGVSIENVKSKGDMRYAESEQWDVYEEVFDTYEDKLVNPIILNEKYTSVMNSNAFLLPQELLDGACIGVYLQVLDKYGTKLFPTDKDYALVTKEIEGEWIASEKYTYKLDFTDWYNPQVTE